MAKREISGTLRNLKFMQRAILKEEKKKNDEEPNGNLPSLSSVRKKCVVITDGDPQPGALVGRRMSFQSFNPSIEANSFTEGYSFPSAAEQGGLSFIRSSNFGEQSEVVSEQHCPNKFRKNGKGIAFKHQKGKKVDWSVLKPSKSQTKTG